MENEKDDCFICPENKVLPFYSISIHKKDEATEHRQH